MWDLIDKIGTIIGIFSAAVSAGYAAWSSWKLRIETKRQWQKQNEQIQVILRSPTREVTLPIELQRGGLTRAELLGAIGMLPMQASGAPRFSLAFLNTHEFSEQLAVIRNSDVDFEFFVPCTEQELDQFKCEKKNLSMANLASIDHQKFKQT